MRRLALAALAAFAAAGPVAAQAVEDTPRPPDSSQFWELEVAADGWERLARSDNQMALVRAPEVTPDGTRRMWVRTEFRDLAIAGGLSATTLIEFDCSQGRFRQLQMTLNAGRNLTGLPRNIPLSSDWEYPVPSSFAENELKAACRDLKDEK